ncbi:putative protein kinase-like domain [Rosellinia necatrix]|uniref:Uncharacterized protein n=1 Tax=Rosellinia necatrix TaxID=77044 RepID=A0A1S8A8H2_ROSNE|nr:putative protein kinase-like domain [Rosellinia necatrix]
MLADGLVWLARFQLSSSVSPPLEVCDYVLQSEAATMGFLQRHTRIPSLRVFSWVCESDPVNTVGVPISPPAIMRRRASTRACEASYDKRNGPNGLSSSPSRNVECCARPCNRIWGFTNAADVFLAHRLRLDILADEELSWPAYFSKRDREDLARCVLDGRKAQRLLFMLGPGEASHEDRRTFAWLFMGLPRTGIGFGAWW